jgi:hypothetical protein
LGLLLVALPALALAQQGEVPAALQSTLNSAAATTATSTDLALQLSQMTGLAMSPLLGLVVLGVWERLTMAPREVLHWYAEWWCVAPLGLLLLVVALKDTLGELVHPLKKPLDAAEVLLNKGTGVLALVVVMGAGGATLGGLISRPMAIAADLVVPMAQAAEASEVLSSPIGILGAVIGALLAGACFSVVWLVGHALNVVLFLNPIPGVAPILKGSRVVVIGLLLSLAVIFPPFGVGASVAVIAVSAYISGYCLRWSTLGTVFAWDLLIGRQRGETDDPRGILVFAGPAIPDVPVRSLGRLVVDGEGQPVVAQFAFRPWLLGPPQHLAPELGRAGVLRGLIFPTIVVDPGEDRRACFYLPPRYRGVEDGVASRLALVGVEDGRLKRGLAGAVDWLREMLARPATARR